MGLRTIIAQGIFGWDTTIEKKVEWVLPYVTGKRVLDIGFVGSYKFGSKLWLHGYLAAAAKECVGLDLEKEAVDHYKGLGFNVMVGNAQNFEVDTQFDVITACDVLEHLQDPGGFFRSVRAALAPQGILVLTVPNPWFFYHFYRCIAKGSSGVHPDHVSWYCEDTLKEMLRRYDFDTVRMELGSPQPFFYRLSMVPRMLRHSSIFTVARKKSTACSPLERGDKASLQEPLSVEPLQHGMESM